MPVINLVQAVNRALRQALHDNEDVILLGEDIGVNGGVFRATEGLLAQFGAQRVFDCPLAESMIAGLSIGMATQGLRPVAEFQFMGFMYPALDQIFNHAARMRHRTRGRLSCPIVFRVPYGGGIGAPEHHSESTEALFAHMPGLRVLVPSCPAHAYGLLLAAIDNADPVIFLEPKRIYRRFTQAVPCDGKRLPLDKACIAQAGTDVTLIAWGAVLQDALAAARQLAEKKIDVEVIDLVSIKPLDTATLLASVAKTGRCVIVHEAPKTGGVGAEIAACLAEQGLMSLLAPVQRVTGYDTVMPYFQCEAAYLPDVSRIMDAVETVVNYT